MKLDGSIFINLGLKAKSEAGSEFRGLSPSALIELFDQAEHAVIISAYYDVPFLKTLFDHAATAPSISSSASTCIGLGARFDPLVSTWSTFIKGRMHAAIGGLLV